MPADPRAPASAPPCAGSRTTTPKAFCGGAVGSKAGCDGAGGVCCVPGADVCGGACDGVDGVCVDCACAENARAATNIPMKNKRFSLLGTSTRIPESFHSGEIVRPIFYYPCRNGGAVHN